MGGLKSKKKTQPLYKPSAPNNMPQNGVPEENSTNAQPRHKATTAMRRHIGMKKLTFTSRNFTIYALSRTAREFGTYNISIRHRRPEMTALI